MGKPFEIDIDCGGGSVIQFMLSEDELRNDPDPAINGAAMGEDRRSVRSAAFERVKRILSRNLDEPITIVEGDSAWIIPVRSIRFIRFRDRETGEERRPFGFVKD